MSGAFAAALAVNSFFWGRGLDPNIVALTFLPRNMALSLPYISGSAGLQPASVVGLEPAPYPDTAYRDDTGVRAHRQLLAENLA